MTKESESHQLSLHFLPQQKLPESQTENKTERQVVTEVTLEAMGEFGSTLRGIFECMEIAEEEIE